MRDPLTDPQPGDVVESRGRQLHVHYRIDDHLYLGRFTSAGVSRGICGAPLSQWQEQCSGARVIQRAEDCSPEVLADLRLSVEHA